MSSGSGRRMDHLQLRPMRIVREVEPPGGFVAAGAVRDTVWDGLHLWHCARGQPVAPHATEEEGVATWPETAVGVRLAVDDAVEVLAPLGLADLFALRLRHNPRQIGVDVFWRRVTAKRWIEQCSISSPSLLESSSDERPDSTSSAFRASPAPTGARRENLGPHAIHRAGRRGAFGAPGLACGRAGLHAVGSHAGGLVSSSRAVPGPVPHPRADWRACSRAATPF